MRACARLVALCALLASTRGSLRFDQQFWRDMATSELDEARNMKLNKDIAKNVILFVGDGMGPNTLTATRIHKGGESHRLSFEKFPHIGLLKTYSANKIVPDSAAAATALFCGVKANQNTVGVDASVSYENCKASLKDNAHLKSLAAIALEAGKSVGLVTTMRVTHSTPAPLYAHSASRLWECEATMPPNASHCKDTARQLIEDWPGRDFHVILGGGRQALVSNVPNTTADPIDSWGCIRQDGRDLITHYQDDKDFRNRKFYVVSNTKELFSDYAKNADYLLGIFANGHMKYEHERNKRSKGMPSITEMTQAAIQVLSKNPKGFFLMVEGGNIDMGHHRGKAKTAINEAVELERAVQMAIDMTNQAETLLVVTSDHTHTLSINGYPDRGSNIFGLAQKKESDKEYRNYTTLSYSTGGPGSFQFEADIANFGQVVRRNITLDVTDSFDYQQIAAITLSENSHGGGDVVVYARGPYAHLFHNVHEQHYVYYVASYAARMGPYSSADHKKTVDIFLLFSVLLITFFLY